MRKPEQRRGEIGLRPLPDAAQALINRLSAPPRLVAHLLLVHDTAVRLVTLIQAAWPDIILDTDTIVLGAALHDIGKIQHPEELSYTGGEHERVGERLLLDPGIDPRVARYARTHGSWLDKDDIELEDLIVALADTSWKGKRDERLEALIVDKFADATAAERWDIFLALDDMIEKVAEDGNRRVAWQSTFPIEGGAAL